MYILGINTYHPDSSAALIKDGKVIAAAEEERFTRVKYDSAFPRHAIAFCLKEAKISIDDVDYIAVARNPYAHLLRKIFYRVTNIPKRGEIFSNVERLNFMRKVINIRSTLSKAFNCKNSLASKKIYFIEHHKCHLAGVYLISGFEKAAILSVDGLGDFTSMMTGIGQGNRIDVLQRVFYPHSIGNLYSTVTHYLGFPYYGDEYQLMALAACGKPIYTKKIFDLLTLKENGSFCLKDGYIDFGGMDFTGGKRPKSTCSFTQKLQEMLGEPRLPGQELTERHKNIAASLQSVLEDLIFFISNKLHERTGIDDLCCSGGVAMNSVANGKILARTPFKRIFTHAAVNDAGNCIGAAFYLYNCILKNELSFIMKDSYFGPAYSDIEIENGLVKSGLEYEILDEDGMIDRVACAIRDRLVVGWFQGKMEFGARALGNRSILTSPHSAEMKDILNSRVKHRESFRPFASSIIEENLQEYYETSHASPFMCLVYPIKRQKLNNISAVAHINGMGRLQTVSYESNPLFYKLIKKVDDKTGIPVVLNTSFNENEPIVCSPRDAIDCFKRTKMDVLAIGSCFVKKHASKEDK